MKLELFNAEANKIWIKAAGRSSSETLRLELDLHKKLLNFFQVGDFYYLIFNVALLDLELVSRELESVLGYNAHEVNMRVLMDSIHPEDRPYFLNFENKAAEFFATLPVEKFMKYKVGYDFRIRKKNGAYMRILHQSTVLEHDETGGIIRTLAVHTDISQLKQQGTPVLSITGLDGEPSYINIDVEKVFAPGSGFLSKRERHVLALLLEGKSSKDIAPLLHISKQTVDKHRKNMLTRNNLKNTGELIAIAIKQGWL
jgi:DNA-binding CsgD family transcriptional regulator